VSESVSLCDYVSVCSIHKCTCVGFYLCPTVLFVFKVHKYESRIAISPCNPRSHPLLPKCFFVLFLIRLRVCVCALKYVCGPVCVTVRCVWKKQKNKNTTKQHKKCLDIQQNMQKNRGAELRALDKNEWEKMASKHVDSVATW